MVTMLIILIFLQLCQLILTFAILIVFGTSVDEIKFALGLLGTHTERELYKQE